MPKICLDSQGPYRQTGLTPFKGEPVAGYSRPWQVRRLEVAFLQLILVLTLEISFNFH